jgi:hypothetical protein
VQGKDEGKKNPPMIAQRVNGVRGIEILISASGIEIIYI